MIALKPVKSKVLQALGYDSATRVLAAKFNENKVYHYSDVPPEVYEQLMAAESVGIAFAKLVIAADFDFTIVVGNQVSPAMESSE